MTTLDQETLWISGDLSKTRSGLAYWRGIDSPRLVRVDAVPRPEAAEFRTTWWRAFGFVAKSTPKTDYTAIILERADGDLRISIPLAVHRGAVLERWRDVQGTDKVEHEVNPSEWRRVAAETLSWGSRQPRQWTWPTDRDACKPISLALVNEHWGLGLEAWQDDEAEAVLVGHWAACTGTLRGRLQRGEKLAADAALKAQRADERAAKAAAKAKADEERAARVAARRGAKKVKGEMKEVA